jgi:hypothetical protein
MNPPPHEASLIYLTAEASHPHSGCAAHNAITLLLSMTICASCGEISSTFFPASWLRVRNISSSVEGDFFEKESQPSHRKIILVAGGPIPHRIGPNEKETTSQGRCYRIEWNLQAHS